MVKFINSNKQIVGVSVTPNIGVEVALLDKKSPTIRSLTTKNKEEYND